MKPIDKVIYRRDPEIKGIEVCRVYDSRHSFPDHAHDGIYAIGMMERGGCYCRGPQKSDSLVAPGQIALINPGQIHSGVPVKGQQASYRMIYFDLNVMATAAGEIFHKSSVLPEFACMVIKELRLWRCLHELYQTIKGPGGRLEKESALMTAVSVLLSLGCKTTPLQKNERFKSRSVRHAMEFLAEELDRKISLEEVARVGGLSRYHFLRVFKQETGLPPHLFRTLRRIDRAKELLRSGVCVAQTALMVGFSDQSHFSNTFRKYTGATPGQYLLNLS